MTFQSDLNNPSGADGAADSGQNQAADTPDPQPLTHEDSLINLVSGVGKLLFGFSFVSVLAAFFLSWLADGQVITGIFSAALAALAVSLPAFLMMKNQGIISSIILAGVYGLNPVLLGVQMSSGSGSVGGLIVSLILAVVAVRGAFLAFELRNLRRSTGSAV